MAEAERRGIVGPSYQAGVQWFLQAVDRRWWLTAGGLATVVTLLGLLLEHRAEPSSSADNALVSVAFGIVIPLFCLSAVSRAFPERLDQSAAPLTRHGADRRWLLLGATSALFASTGCVGAALAGAVRALGGSVVARGTGDVLACIWIGGLAAVTYSAWFLLGATFGARGRGRWVALLLDWALGIGTGLVALPWPRGHLRSLLGGAQVAGLEQSHSSALLLVLVAVYVTLALTRCPR